MEDIDYEELMNQKFGKPNQMEDHLKVAQQIIEDDYAMVRDKIK